MNAPLSDFMRLWFPNRKQVSIREIESNYKKCVYDECSGDTAYSWGPPEKLKAIQATLLDHEAWNGNPNPGHSLYTAFTAVGAYAYGSVPIRFKLKADSGVSLHSEIQSQEANEIESWSFGMPEHYDEIVRDFLRFKSKKLWRGYWATSDFSVVPKWTGTDNSLFFKFPLDEHEWSEDKLKTALLVMIKTILRGEGRIYYAKNACRNRKTAFETRLPTFINPFPSSNSSGNSAR
jgi:hypothetical protein